MLSNVDVEQFVAICMPMCSLCDHTAMPFPFHGRLAVLTALAEDRHVVDCGLIGVIRGLNLAGQFLPSDGEEGDDVQKIATKTTPRPERVLNKEAAMIKRACLECCSIDGALTMLCTILSCASGSSSFPYECLQNFENWTQRFEFRCTC